MIELPLRRQYPTRDDFAAAVSATFEELWGRYQAEPVTHSIPEWEAYNVSLPIEIANQGGDAHGISSIIKHMLEMRKSSIGRICRVERDGQWMVFFEAK